MELKIEVGKKYKLRNGRIARCICTDRAGTWCIVLLKQPVPHDPVESLLTTDAGGRCRVGGSFDVISEYREPRVLYAFFNKNDRYLFSNSSEEERDYALRHNTSGNTCHVFVEKQD